LGFNKNATELAMNLSLRKEGVGGILLLPDLIPRSKPRQSHAMM